MNTEITKINAKRIARGKTFDDKSVVLWENGHVTLALGHCLPGVGVSHSAYEQRLDVEAGWIVIGEAGLYNGNELSKLVKAARKAVRQRFDQPLRATRLIMAGKKIQVIKNGVFEWRDVEDGEEFRIYIRT